MKFNVHMVLRWSGWAGLMMCALAAGAQAPLTINGVTDKSTYNDSVTLQVPSVAGYTYRVLLDNQPMPTDFPVTVTNMDYHELAVSRTNTATGAVTNQLVRFIVLSSQRGSPEKGLIQWTPYPAINSAAAEFAGAHLNLLMPREYPAGLPIPIVARVEDDQGRERRANGWVTAEGFENAPVPLQILRGHGSGFLAPATGGTQQVIHYNARLFDLTASRQIQIDETTVWTPVSGTLNGANTWPANSRIHLTGSITIPADSTLTVEAGTIVKLSPLVNITNSGTMIIAGTTNQPVVFTATNIVWPEVPAGAWGGFLLRGSTSKLVANCAILAGGGGATSFDFSPGASHRSEQAVLLIHSGAHAYLTNCAIINTAGQVGNGYNCDYVADHCHYQRAITGGEYAGSSSVVIFNHTANFEFPNDDGVVNAGIADADYDGIYFTEGRHELLNSLFGFAKDDAIDSGSGNAGTMWVSNCWVESAQHEAHAWSGGGRQAWSFNTVLLNSGQGIECGWSTGSDSPLCFADHLLLLGNSVGARVGDNYDWNYTGFLRLTNSLILNNYRDIFLKTWNGVKTGPDTNSWVDRVLQVDFRSNYVTTVEARFPGNLPWDPATESWRLAYWMTTPPDASVGIGLAVRTNRFPLAALYQGVPVRLSTFTTNFVSVDYAFVNSNGPLAGGTVTFAPGEMVKRIYPGGFDLATNSAVDVVLSNPVRGELTSVTNATFAGSVAAPVVSLNVITNRYSAWRLTEGVFVSLNTPSALPVSVDYHFDTTNGVVEAGTLVFNPLETRRQIFLTAVSPFDQEEVQLTVANPTNAALTGITNVTYTYVVVPLAVSLGVTNQQDLAAFAGGVPVMLNAPAVEGVSVDFEVAGNRNGRTNGTLAFAKDELGQMLLAPTIDPAQNDFIKVTLRNPVKAAWAGPDTVYYVRVTAAPPVTPVTLVARGAQSLWRYNATGVYPGATWTATTFNDSAWPVGGAPLGYEDTTNGYTTIHGYGGNANAKYITYYYRHAFVATNPAALESVTFNLLRDDGAVVYLNGAQLYSENMPATFDNSTVSATNVSGNPTIYRPTTFVLSALPAPLVAGTNVVAVEIHQRSATSSDVKLDLEIVGNPWPVVVQPPLYHGVLDGALTLAWGDAALKLLQATNLGGPWSTNTEAGIFSTRPTNAQSYYRLMKP